MAGDVPQEPEYYDPEPQQGAGGDVSKPHRVSDDYPDPAVVECLADVREAAAGLGVTRAELGVAIAHQQGKKRRNGK